MDTHRQRRNARAHLIEGALYIASGAFIAGPTVMPAIVLHLGGSDVVVGMLPVIIYLAFYAPQLFLALHARSQHQLKPWVIRGGLVQRLHILTLAGLLALSAGKGLDWVLPAFLVVLALNQFWAGLVSPVWFDFLARTTDRHRRGRLLGARSALGAFLSFLNSFVLTASIAWLGFSWGMAAAFAVAFLFQTSSLVVQRGVVEPDEEFPKTKRERHRVSDIARILRTDRRMRRFLIAWGFVTAGASTGVFIMPAAVNRFGQDPSAVGIYTIVLVAAQMLGSGALGWLTDRRGARWPLMICGASGGAALLIATVAGSPEVMVASFVALGIPLGAEMMARYNFAIESSPADERSLTVGIMNVWLAPWQALSLVAGMSVERWGYESIFLAAASVTFLGVVLLFRVPANRVA